MTISIVAAVAENGVIGRDGGLPWRLPADTKFFKELTSGHTVIMGRKTWDEIARPLRHRRNIVITRNRAWSAEGAERAGSLAAALDLAGGEAQVFVIGGAEIYRRALPIADRMYLTHVHAEVEGDTIFPEWDAAEWRIAHEQRFEADERNVHGFTITEYVRRS
ncbi:MAG: dihydrofolate reductase [Gemmatimonadales bacterium]